MLTLSAISTVLYSLLASLSSALSIASAVLIVALTWKLETYQVNTYDSSGKI